MEKKILFLAGALVLAATLIVSVTVLASHEATQQASTAKATTINIVDKTDSTAITTITFPEGAPSATVSVPYNNVNTDTDPQVLSTTTSEPVVRLENTAGVAYNVTLEITTWTNSLVDMEYYNLAASGATNIDTVTDALSAANGAANTVSTGVSIPTTEFKDLYLKLVLSEIAAQTGASTLTVLGETA